MSAREKLTGLLKEDQPLREKYKRTKLLPENDLLSDRRVLLAVGIGIVALCLFAAQILCRSIANLPAMFHGQPTHSLLVPSLDFIGWYFLAFLIGAGLAIVFAYRIRSSFTAMNVGQKGKARFATFAEIRETYKEIPEKDLAFPGRGGLPVARSGDRLYIDDSINNNLIEAITRGGKGEILVIPTIDILSRAKEQSSMVIFDVKGELARASSAKLIERGYEIFILDLIDPEHTMYWNLLQIVVDYYMTDKSMAEEACRTIASSIFEDKNAKDRFWVNAPIDLFTAVAIAHVEDCLRDGHPEKINMYSVYLFIVTLEAMRDEKSKESALDQFFMSRPATDRARLKYATIKFSEGKTRASILSILASELSIFGYENIAKMTALNTIDLLKIGFGDKPVAVFLRVPQSKKPFYPLVSIFVNQMYFRLTDYASSQNKGKCRRPVKVIGDEAFNFPPLLDADGMLSVCLGYQISFDLYAQSRQQIYKVYGKEAGEIIEDNCSTLVYLISPGEDTRKMVSERLGNYTSENVSRSGGRFSLGKNITESYEERPLMSTKELLEMREGDMIVVPLMKRRNLKGERIIARPVKAAGETAMKYRYEYLTDFDPAADIPYEALPYSKPLTEIDLNELFYLPQESGQRPDTEIPALQQEAPCLHGEKLKFVAKKLNAVGIYLDSLETIPIPELLEQMKEFYQFGTLSDMDYTAMKKLIE